LGNITGLPFKTIYKGVVPFLSALVVALAIMFIFPNFAIWLPNQLMGK
jgi:TRAP-type C4-dicarboxylate transport system permease large subunit